MPPRYGAKPNVTTFELGKNTKPADVIGSKKILEELFFPKNSPSDAVLIKMVRTEPQYPERKDPD